MLFVPRHADKRQSRILYRLALLFLVIAVLTAFFFPDGYDLTTRGENYTFHVNTKITLSLLLAFMAAGLFLLGVKKEPAFEVNTKKVFTANASEFTVILSFPADRYLTIRWMHVEQIKADAGRNTFRIEISSDYMDLNDNLNLDDFLIDNICLSKTTPGFEMLAATVPPQLHHQGGKLLRKGNSTRNKKRKQAE
jgi:hypothetical protein